MSTIDPIPDPAPRADFVDDAAVLAVDGVVGLFPAQSTFGLVSGRVVAAVTGASGAAPSVSVRPEPDGTAVTARIAASTHDSARDVAARVADRLLELHPEEGALVRVQVARIQ